MSVIEKFFMRLVVNAIGILFLHARGFDVKKEMALWSSKKDDFLDLLNKE